MNSRDFQALFIVKWAPRAFGYLYAGPVCSNLGILWHCLGSRSRAHILWFFLVAHLNLPRPLCLRRWLPLFSHCSPRLAAHFLPRFLLLPVKSHVISRPSRKQTQRAPRPEPKTTIAGFIQAVGFHDRTIRRAREQTSPRVAVQPDIPSNGPSDGTRAADRAVAAARSAFLFREPEKRDRIERKARRWRASSEARKM